MSDAPPVHAAPRPLLELLSRAMNALFDPIEPAPRRSSCAGGAPAGRWACFETPTYRRRRLRIVGLEDDVEPLSAGPGLRAPDGSTRPAPPPRA
jgi:hypothetical protein